MICELQQQQQQQQQEAAVVQTRVESRWSPYLAGSGCGARYLGSGGHDGDDGRAGRREGRRDDRRGRRHRVEDERLRGQDHVGRGHVAGVVAAPAGCGGVRGQAGRGRRRQRVAGGEHSLAQHVMLGHPEGRVARRLGGYPLPLQSGPGATWLVAVVTVVVAAAEEAVRFAWGVLCISQDCCHHDGISLYFLCSVTINSKPVLRCEYIRVCGGPSRALLGYILMRRRRRYC